MSASVTLVIQREGHPDRRVPLSPGAVQIGRAEDNDIVLSDIGVSRRHARVLVENGGVLFEDLGSGNGSWLGGKRVRTHDVSDGDAIHVEPFMLRFEVKGPAQVEVEPEPEVPAPPARAPEPEPRAPAPEPPPREEPPAPAPDPARDAPAAVLEAVSGGGIAGQRFEIPPQGLTIGRHEQRDVVLQDVAASRFHAEVAPRGEVYWVRDCNSANGVLVNGQKVREKPLRDGDVLKIGSTELRFAADLQPAYMTDVIDEEAPDQTDAFDHVLDDEPGPWGTQPAQSTHQTFTPPASPAFSSPPAAQGPGFTQPSSSSSGFGAPGDLHTVEAGEVLTPRASAPAAVAPSQAPGTISSFPPPEQPPPPGVAPPQTGAPAAQPGFGVPPAAPLGPPPDLGATPAGGGFGGLEMQLDGSGGGRGKKLKVRSSDGFLSKPINRLTLVLLGFAILSVGGKAAHQELSMPKAAKISVQRVADEPADLSHLEPLEAAEVGRLMDEGMALVKAGKYYDATAKFRRVLQLDQTNQAAQEAGYLTCELIVIDALREHVEARDADAGEKAELRTEAIEAARDALDGGRGVIEAIKLVEEALAVLPSDEELQGLLDELSAKRSAQYRHAVQRNQEELEGKVKELYDRGEAELSRGNNMGAHRYFEKAMQEDPERQTATYFQAQDGLSQAKRAMDQESRQHYQAAMNAMRTGDYVTARSSFKRTLKANPYNTAAKTKLAEVQELLVQAGVQKFQAGKRMEAANQFEKAVTHYTECMRLIDDRSNQTFQNAQQRVSMLSSVLQ